MKMTKAFQQFFFAAASLGLVLFSFNFGHLAHAADANFITLSSYYALPGQSIAVRGAGFFPNEMVTVSFAGTIKNVAANRNGIFVTPRFVVPFSVINTNQLVDAQGSMGHDSTANLVIGTFYPVVTPSSWYLSAGSMLNFRASHFAPNETVTIQMNGIDVSRILASSSGNFNATRIFVPSTPGDLATYSFIGESSGVRDDITVNVAMPLSF